MMRIRYAILITITLLAFCFRLNAQDKIFIKNIEYDVPIFNESASMGPFQGSEWWKNNLETSARVYLEKSMIRKAMNGDINVYDAYGKLLSKADVKKTMTQSIDTITFIRAEPPYDVIDSIIPIEISADEIIFLRFRETWSYDLKSLSIQKTIKEYAPICKVNSNNDDLSYDETNVKYIPLFWIKCNTAENDGNKFNVLTYLIESNCKIDNRLPNYPGFYNLTAISTDSFSRKAFISELCDSAQKGDIAIYRPLEVTEYLLYNRDVLEKLNKKQKDSLFRTNSMIRPPSDEPPYDNYDSVVYENFDPNTIALLRFQEKWLINPSTLEIKKEVISIIPAQILYIEESNIAGIKPLFAVFFSKVSRLFPE
jgi:hypothetical protein